MPFCNATVVAARDGAFSHLKPIFIALMEATIETALAKKCDPQIVAFSQNDSKDHSLAGLAVKWTPVVETLLALVTARDDTKDFGTKLFDDQYIPALAKQMNRFYTLWTAAEKHKAFSDLVGGT